MEDVVDFSDCHNDAITYYTWLRYHRQLIATRLILVALAAAFLTVVYW